MNNPFRMFKISALAWLIMGFSAFSCASSYGGLDEDLLPPEEDELMELEESYEMDFQDEEDWDVINARETDDDTEDI